MIAPETLVIVMCVIWIIKGCLRMVASALAMGEPIEIPTYGYLTWFEGFMVSLLGVLCWVM